MKRLLVLLCVLALGLTVLAADKKDKEPTAKEALQALNDFIGGWKGNGGPEKANPASKDLWKENASWGWRFKGDDAWLVIEIKDGKYFKSGEVRYLTDKKVYQMKLIDKNDKEQIFEGEYKTEPAPMLTLEHVDAATKETQQIKMNTTNEGVRLNFYFARKPDGRTLFTKDYLVAYNKEGESIGAKEKKNECVVSGGLGTIQVSFGGKTYWVCCSGCKDAFNENPEKYIKEFEAKKKMK
jgi:hypothetical protein